MTSLFKSYGPVLIIVGLLLLGALFVVGTNYNAFFKHPTSATGTTKLDKDIATLEGEIAQRPTTSKPFLNLASLYLQKVRETSDSSYYTKIDELMDKAVKLSPTDADIPAIRASVAMGRHDFVTGKKFIQEALALNDHTAAYYGLDGDADIELGRYADAITAFQKMVNMRPDFSSWSRIAYIRELYGDIPGAKTALNQAITSGSSYPENTAWAYVERGKLEMRTDTVAADASFNEALIVLPTYTPAMEGLGKSAFARGDYAEAEKQFVAAYDGLALAQYAIDLGDLYGAKGDTVKAAQQYALAQAAFDLSAKGGVDTDLEESLFLADHNLNLDQALAMARRAYTARPNIYSADYLAWALYKNGQTEEAAKYANDAFKIGKNDPLILFHQGTIALANGDAAHAKEYLSLAQSINPHFSIQYAEQLKTSLDSLK